MRSRLERECCHKLCFGMALIQLITNKQTNEATIEKHFNRFPSMAGSDAICATGGLHISDFIPVDLVVVARVAVATVPVSIH